MPFALYIPTSFPDRLGELWWVALEAVIAQNGRIGLVIDGEDQCFECGTVKEKRELYDAIYGYLRSMKTEDELRRTVRDLCACYRVDIASFCRELCMSWEEIARARRRSAGAPSARIRSITRCSRRCRTMPPCAPKWR